MKSLIKILIADTDEIARRALKDYLHKSGFTYVFDTDSGDTALDIIESLHPDVVVTDIWLSGTNGIRLYKNAKNDASGIAPAFVFTSSVENADLCKSIVSDTYDTYVLKPCDMSALERQIVCAYTGRLGMESLTQKNVALLSKGASEVALETRVTSIIRNFGISAQLKGYGFLRSAIIHAFNDITMIDMLTKKLYPTVAREFSTTPSRVERNIRHAIETIWNEDNYDLIKEYFSRRNADFCFKPTNGEFIAVIADRLRLEMAERQYKELGIHL